MKKKRSLMSSIKPLTEVCADARGVLLSAVGYPSGIRDVSSTMVSVSFCVHIPGVQ